MILGAFRVSNSFRVRDYVDFVNYKLGVSSALFSGKVSLLNDDVLLFNVRFWLFNPSFLKGFYSWLFIKGLRKKGYVGPVEKLSGVELSKLLEGYL